MIALLQSLLCEPLPALRPINGLSSLHRDIEVTAFNGQLETSIGVLYEVQSNLREFQKRVKSEVSWQRTSGNPFCCRYAMMLWPSNVDVLMMYSISS